MDTNITASDCTAEIVIETRKRRTHLLACGTDVCPSLTCNPCINVHKSSALAATTSERFG